MDGGGSGITAYLALFIAAIALARYALSEEVLLISSHFEHYGSVSVARAQCKCIGHGPRSCFRSVRSEMKSTVQRISLALNNWGTGHAHASVVNNTAYTLATYFLEGKSRTIY